MIWAVGGGGGGGGGGTDPHLHFIDNTILLCIPDATLMTK